jgi:DnaK suppressor protein
MDQNSIRETLRVELKTLLGRTERIDAHWRNEAPPADWAELAIHQENDEVIESLEERAREQIYSIKRTFQRMDDGSWNSCSSCGSVIQAARLKALPTTTLCVSCAELSEHH